jgi:RNA polymerase subunit RPABC4/transcription elongation factor Spt4
VSDPTVACPVCGRRINTAREVCPAHTDKIGRRCPMSGQPMAVAS